MSLPTHDTVHAALATVSDPEIHRPITDLGMVESIDIAADGRVAVGILLTTQGCPLRDRITRDVTAAVEKVPGVTSVAVSLGVMSDEQRQSLRTTLQGDRAGRVIPFAQPGSLTRVYAVASGKGGVGKSSTTANLAVAMAQDGLNVGVVDADVYGYSLPKMFGITGRPTLVEGMLMPPEGHGVKLVSAGMFVPENRAIPMRGPMLHKWLEQILGDAYFGDLDVLLLDLPPGTGDVALSTAALLPTTEVVVVTTPQRAAREVAERAGAVALQTRLRVAGVIEHMAGLPCPHCGEMVDIFGSGGGQAVADSLGKLVGAPVPLLGSVPIDPRLRAGGDAGVPIVIAQPDAPAAVALRNVAEEIGGRSRSLVGRPLTLTPVN